MIVTLTLISLRALRASILNSQIRKSLSVRNPSLLSIRYLPPTMRLALMLSCCCCCCLSHLKYSVISVERDISSTKMHQPFLPSFLPSAVFSYSPLLRLCQITNSESQLGDGYSDFLQTPSNRKESEKGNCAFSLGNIGSEVQQDFVIAHFAGL